MKLAIALLFAGLVTMIIAQGPVAAVMTYLSVLLTICGGDMLVAPRTPRRR